MSADITVTTTPDIAAVAANIRAISYGGKALKKELSKVLMKIGDDVLKAEQAAIRGATIKGVKANGGIRNLRAGSAKRTKYGMQKAFGGRHALRESIAASLERRSRLDAKVMGVEVRSSASKLTQRIPGGGKLAKMSNSGIIRHPVFGDRETWASQRVMPAGWWTKTGNEMKGPIRERIRAVGVEFEKQIEQAAKG